MALYAIEHSGHRIEVDLRWTGKAKLTVDGRTVDEGSTFGTTLKLLDTSPESDVVINVDASGLRARVVLLAEGEQLRIAKAP